MNLRTTPDALQMVLVPENMEMLERHKIFSEEEIRSRYEITMENYVRTVRIEALTMAEMAREEILPAVMHYTGDLAAGIVDKKKAVASLPCRAETRLLEMLSDLSDAIDAAIDALQASVGSCEDEDITAQAFFIRDELLGKMSTLRTLCDEAETLTAASYWPFPTYGELLFKV